MLQEREDSISQDIVSFLQEEASHGLPHAQETVRLTQEILSEPEYRGRLPEHTSAVLSHAALLHDIGYGSYEPWWSGMQEEHPAASCLRAHAILKYTDFYQQHPELLGSVLWLIYNHDNTNYTFPAYWRLEEQYLSRRAPTYSIPRLLPGTYRSLPGSIADLIGRENAPQVVRFTDLHIDLLQILQEADSRLGDAPRTLAFCQKRGIPTFVNEGGVLGVGPLWWQMSAAVNIILALNRSLLDAYTVSGQEIARKIYHDGMRFIQELYDQALADPSMCKPESGMSMIGALSDCDIDQIFSRQRNNRWNNQGVDQASLSLCMGLETTLGEIIRESGKPYQYIASRIASLNDLSNTDGKENVMYEPDVDVLMRLRGEILRRYGMDIFSQLVGSTHVEVFKRDWVLGDEMLRYLIRPPVVNIANIGAIGRPPYELLFGTKWLTAVKEVGLEKTRVLFVH